MSSSASDLIDIMNKTQIELRDRLLRETDNGLYFFLKLYPELWVQVQFGDYVTFDSPFTGEIGMLSIYFNDKNGKWFFKDHSGDQPYGDMFSYVAFVHKLDYRKNFGRIMSIIEAEMKDYYMPLTTTLKLVNNATQEYIVFYK